MNLLLTYISKNIFTSIVKSFSIQRQFLSKIEMKVTN